MQFFPKLMNTNRGQEAGTSAPPLLRSLDRVLVTSVVTKPRLQVILRFLLLLAALLPAAAQAQDFLYTTNDGALTITGYTGPGGGVVVPDMIDGLPVTRIGAGAFFNQPYLTSVVIARGIATIGDGSFESCSGLTNVTLPNGITSIENVRGWFWKPFVDPITPGTIVA